MVIFIPLCQWWICLCFASWHRYSFAIMPRSHGENATNFFFFFSFILSLQMAGIARLQSVSPPTKVCFLLRVLLGFLCFSLCFFSGWKRSSLSARDSSLSSTAGVSPPFLPPSLPQARRARQRVLILDWAALPSASRRCWESMARLQEPCAHAGEKWNDKRKKGSEREGRRHSGVELIHNRLLVPERCRVLVP